MKAKKLFPDLSIKRLWDKIKGIEDKVNEQNKKLGGLSFYSCTQSQYDGMSSHDSNTIYFIKG